MLGQSFGALIYGSGSQRDEAIPAPLCCPEPVVAVISKRCVYEVLWSAAVLIPLNLSGKNVTAQGRDKEPSSSLPKGNWGVSEFQDAFPTVSSVDSY